MQEGAGDDPIASHRVADQQFSASYVHVTASTDEKPDHFTSDKKARGCKSSYGFVPLNGSRGVFFRRPVFESPYPPISLVIGRLPSITSSRVVTKSWLVIKRCTSPLPTANPTLEVEAANCAQKRIESKVTRSNEQFNMELLI